MKNILRKPLVSEKNTGLAEQGTYVFEVDMKASKPEIKAAVEQVFEVKVEGVRVLKGRGRAKMTKLGRVPTPYFKKAFIKLKEGQKIAMFEGV